MLWPTLLGWLCILLLLLVPSLLWVFRGESFLSQTARVPARILVVEGWISAEGLDAAAQEFKTGGYSTLVATGSLTGAKWEAKRWDYTQAAYEQFVKDGIAPERIILASAGDPEVRRTYSMALATRNALLAHHLLGEDVNIFTRGPHARRSRLIYARVLGSPSHVGSIAWIPPGFLDLPWWRSSERTKDMLTETPGYFVELIFGPRRAPPAPSHDK